MMIRTICNYLIRWMPALLLCGLYACHKDNPVTGASPGTILTPPLKVYLDNNADYSSFDSLLKKSGFYQYITGSDSIFTLFIPDNAAFAAAGINIDSMLNLPAPALQSFVGYHILRGAYPTAVIPQSINNPDTTLSGQVIYLSKPVPTRYNSGTAQQAAQISQTLHVNGITLNKTDLIASNGVIDVLSYPLSLPFPNIQAYFQAHPEYSLLVAALKKFNLYAQLDSAGPYTIFAPNNNAFLNNGIDSTLISSDTFDTKHFEPFLFSAGLVPGRIFTTDFSDAQTFFGGSGVTPAIYSVYGSVQFGNNGSGYNIVVYSWVPGCCGGFTQIGSNPNYTFTNQPTVNGVIHGLDNILVYPANVYIPQ
jgi:uncharacterized surface protein with fasciclin (FAS1) repeats